MAVGQLPKRTVGFAPVGGGRRGVIVYIMLPERGPGPERVCLGPANSVWVLYFVKEKMSQYESV